MHSRGGMFHPLFDCMRWYTPTYGPTNQHISISDQSGQRSTLYAPKCITKFAQNPYFWHMSQNAGSDGWGCILEHFWLVLNESLTSDRCRDFFPCQKIDIADFPTYTST